MELFLPDRNGRLDPVDGRPTSREGFGAMRGDGGDRHGRLADREAPDAMLDPNPRRGELADEALGDLRHLGLGHRTVRLVLDRRGRTPLVLVPHDADEEAQRAVGRPGLREKGGDVERRAREKTAHPPATGGRNATSSPSRRTVSRDAYSRLTAAGGGDGRREKRGTSRASAAQSSETRDPSGNSRTSSSRPAASRNDAKCINRTFMWEVYEKSGFGGDQLTTD